MKNYQLVYLPGGSVSHLLDEMHSPSDSRPARCGTAPPIFGGGWYGTGNQGEHDEAERRATCTRCLVLCASDQKERDDAAAFLAARRKARP